MTCKATEKLVEAAHCAQALGGEPLPRTVAELPSLLMGL